MKLSVFTLLLTFKSNELSWTVILMAITKILISIFILIMEGNVSSQPICKLLKYLILLKLYCPYLIFNLLGHKIFLPYNKEYSKYCHNHTMTNVPKHHSKQEGKWNNSKWSCNKNKYQLNVSICPWLQYNNCEKLSKD